jgi:CHAD domain-containing protein
MKGGVKVKSNRSLYENATAFIPSMYDEMMSHRERVIGHPRLKNELHRMRVAGKPLRYAMEIFETTIGKAFASCFDETKDLIELLGEVHDCDVTKLLLQNYLHELRLYNGSCDTKDKKLSLRGIRELINRQKAQRARSFAEMCSLLNKWKKQNFRNKLINAMK